MIWNFINGWQKKKFKLVNGLLMFWLTTNMCNANSIELPDEPPSLELLEMLGQFDKKDDNWFDNEIKNINIDYRSKQNEQKTGEDENE